MGPEALAWVDWVAETGCRYWQMRPLGPTGDGDSPYQCFSAFAGNPYLISPDALVADGLADPDDVPAFPLDRVDFGRVIPWKIGLLDEAHRRFVGGDAPHLRPLYEEFAEDHRHWLADYALFMAVKRHHGGGPFWEWPEEIRVRHPSAVRDAGDRLAVEIDRQLFQQFVFHRQWSSVRRHAAERGVQLIGDAPIFVASDSADVWARPDLFKLDDDLHPTVVAGVPPDYFSPTGQLWGNPHYDWERHADDDYAWWVERLRSLLGLVDVVRLDHFRAFADAWEIPAGSETAEHGAWVLGPGRAVFDAAAAALGSLPIIAEDLGELHEIVPQLRDDLGLPGMKIGLFGYGDQGEPPEAWPHWSVAYTGTHDNATTREWLDGLDEAERARVSAAMGVETATSWSLVEKVWTSEAVLTVTTAQDLLDLGAEARMNLPGTLGPHNWTWRLASGAVDAELATRLADLNRTSGRWHGV